MTIYTVVPGDSLFQIARRFGTTPARLAADNGIPQGASLAVGESLVITEPTQTYTVREGDTLLSVARSFGVSVNALLRNNPELSGTSAITPGQVLVISLEPPALGPVSTNGYAYPYISESVLRATLPYLTYVTPFSYGINSSGSLIDLDDGRIIELAIEYGAVPVMLISTLTEDGVFSSARASLILRDPDLQSSLIEEIIATARRKGYAGIDVDFEYIPAADRENYIRFITDLNAAATPFGLEVWVALAPKTSATQPGLLYEAHDYAALGAAADAVLLMTYEWGYTYGPPMAVAPLNKVREVLDYAVTEIPSYKIFMGIPNYGYDWTLPFVPGESRARSLSNLDAVELARGRQAVIEFDEVAASPYFYYYDGGVRHEVWFEDARSAEAKAGTLAGYGFRGCGVWNLMRYFPGLWVVINSLFNIRKIE